MNEKFKGTGVALITPFQENGAVDIPALKKLVAYQKENGIDFLVVLGTTGEYPTLNNQEREQVKNAVLEENNGALTTVLGIGGNNTQEVQEKLRSESTEGFDGILSVSPYYNKPSQEGMYQHFKAVAHASPLPVILYNVPGRTGKNMEPTTVARLARDFDNIIGVKEAAGDMVQAMAMINQTPEDFHVISGEDLLTLPMVLAGGSGVISVTAQGFPTIYSEMVRLGLERKVDEAYALHYKLTPATELVFEEGNPAGIKAVLHTREIAENHTRLPIVPASQELQNRVEKRVASF